MLALALGPADALAGGTILAVDGKALIQRSGQEDMPASAATPVDAGDTLVVAKLARVTLQFDDDSHFVIPGPSTLQVEEFQAPGAGQRGKAAYRLVEGGFRTVTGSIPSENYSVQAPEAAIATEGTAYTLLRCTTQCGSRHKQGLYVRSDRGVVVVSNAGGTLRLRMGLVAYVANNQTAGVLVQSSPFSDPQFEAAYEGHVEPEGAAHPPRIERETPASPS